MAGVVLRCTCGVMFKQSQGLLVRGLCEAANKGTSGRGSDDGNATKTQNGGKGSGSSGRGGKKNGEEKKGPRKTSEAKSASSEESKNAVTTRERGRTRVRRAKPEKQAIAPVVLPHQAAGTTTSPPVQMSNAIAGMGRGQRSGSTSRSRPSPSSGGGDGAETQGILRQAGAFEDASEEVLQDKGLDNAADFFRFSRLLTPARRGGRVNDGGSGYDKGLRGRKRGENSSSRDRKQTKSGSGREQRQTRKKKEIGYTMVDSYQEKEIPGDFARLLTMEVDPNLTMSDGSDESSVPLMHPNELDMSPYSKFANRYKDDLMATVAGASENDWKEALEIAIRRYKRRVPNQEPKHRYSFLPSMRIESEVRRMPSWSKRERDQEEITRLVEAAPDDLKMHAESAVSAMSMSPGWSDAEKKKYLKRISALSDVGDSTDMFARRK